MITISQLPTSSTPLLPYFLLRNYSKFHSSKVHLWRARCPHYKYLIVNLCTSYVRNLLYQDLRRTTISSQGEWHSPLQVVYDFVFCVSPVYITPKQTHLI
ncbi:MAG: hypothetical protein F6K39_24850 [Okeania sp. SIO3B3]|nr:hypothetical protein [Okeania sp. SIO3B3]